MTRWQANSGRCERVADEGPPADEVKKSGPTRASAPAGRGAPFAPFPSFPAPQSLETEDLLLMAVLSLLYRECGDRQFLLAIAAYVFL